jgi:hypothetical protein
MQIWGVDFLANSIRDRLSQYILTIDGKIVDKKQMIIAK